MFILYQLVMMIVSMLIVGLVVGVEGVVTWQPYFQAQSKTHHTTQISNLTRQNFTMPYTNDPPGGTNYQFSLALVGQQQNVPTIAPNNYSRHSIFVKEYSSSLTQMTIQIQTLIPNQSLYSHVQMVTVRILLFDPAFPYFIVQKQRLLINDSYSRNNPLIYQLQLTIANLNSTGDYVGIFLRGYDIQAMTSGQQYQVSLRCTTKIDGNVVNLTLQNDINSQYFINEIQFDLLIYRRYSMTASGQLSPFQIGNYYYNNAFTSAHLNTVNPNLIYYGIFNIRNFLTNPIFNFDTSTTSNAINIDVYGSNKYIGIYYIVFVTDTSCPFDTYYNVTTINCETCLNGTFLQPVNQTCISCDQFSMQCLLCNAYTCLKCSPGLIVITAYKCGLQCGDGIAYGSEICDDNNTQNKDGCSSSCLTEQYFYCDISVIPSSCTLTRLDMTIKSMVKTDDKNEIIISIDLFPQNILFYTEVDWSKMVSSFSHQMSSSWVTFDQENNRLRMAVSYTQNLNEQSISMLTDFSPLSTQFNLSAVSVSLPKTTSNNQALYYYEDSTYQLQSIIKYLSIITSALCILLFILGYLGCKIQSIQGVAVVQVAALLLMTVKEMGPSFTGLKQLGYSLGITPFFQEEYFYQNSHIPGHLIPILMSNDSISLINVFLVVLVGPVLVALIIKILSVTKFKGSFGAERAWKYALGTFTFYSLLFLTYGELASLVLNIRYFRAQLSYGIGIIIGTAFLLMLIIYVILLEKYHIWFGSFKKKFFRYQISQHFYTFSAIERVVTVTLIVCLSPGVIAAGVVTAIFFIEAIFIAVDRPYVLREWKRPLLIKCLAILVGLLYVGASLTTADSNINQFIPIGILLVLLVVLVVSVISAMFQLHEFCQTRGQNIQVQKKAGPPLSVEECNSILMKEFQMKLIPNTENTTSLWRPVQHDFVDINKWRWEQYPIIGGLDLHMKMHESIRAKINKIPEEGEVQEEDHQQIESEEKKKKMIKVDSQI